MSNVALRIISKFGGAPKLAKAIGVDPSNVYRWTYPKERPGGTDGLIPTQQQQKIIQAAKSLGIKLQRTDFYPGPPRDRTRHRVGA